MSEDQETEVGYIRYEGDLVPRGILGARLAGNALLSVDDALRFFNRAQSPAFDAAPYEIPVKVRNGSWEAAIIASGTIVATTYLATAAKEMAKRDFEGIGLKDIFAKSLDAIRDLIRLAKHTRRMGGWDLTEVKWRNQNTEVGIKGESGEIEYFPWEYVKWYSKVPPKILLGLAEAVEEGRELEVYAGKPGQLVKEAITPKDKRIFVAGEDPTAEDEVFLFPELEHGQRISVEGVLTRGNSSTNSLGFLYEGHILNCVPETGSIVQYKPALFLKCRLDGIVSRLHSGKPMAERRPTLIIQRLVMLEVDQQGKLFDAES
ncbi:hypothetical protein [Algiphilus sp.]|uniref:hypothetical protein n=1 Tax=Algiphilus sp. TaxID=1872431 RepID=UPI0032EF03DC